MKLQIKLTNRKLMSTVSQLSIYKATAIQVNKENEDMQQLLDLADRNMSRGEAPLPEAEEEWYKMELRRYNSIKKNDNALLIFLFHRMREQRERENVPPPQRTTVGMYILFLRLPPLLY